MIRPGIDCPKCSKDRKPIPTERRHIPAGERLTLSSLASFQINHPCEVDYCARCRGWYPVELKGQRL